MQNATQQERLGAALGVVYVIWGSTYLAIAVAIETLPPLLAASLRFILAGAIMALVVRARGGTLRVTRGSLGAAMLVGYLLPGANAELFFAERSVRTGLASLIFAAVPLGRRAATRRAPALAAARASRGRHRLRRRLRCRCGRRAGRRSQASSSASARR